MRGAWFFWVLLSDCLFLIPNFWGNSSLPRQHVSPDSSGFQSRFCHVGRGGDLWGNREPNAYSTDQLEGLRVTWGA